ncbi:WD40 repeat-like protein [Rozella allomycis CSF55]|uniref:WD40 repeat-like protein n=1 Tax=Rozella allomycis (strain CSF55) TaxID=988480 RepID=A0A4P9YC65_ROZAC|nr:WD40 repeat-like protein [Rozella allomycis CSF55]
MSSSFLCGATESVLFFDDGRRFEINKISDMSISSDNTDLAACSGNKLYFLNSGLCEILKVSKHPIVMMAVNMDDSYIAAVSSLKQVIILSVTNGHTSFLPFDFTEITSINFSNFKKSMMVVSEVTGECHLVDIISQTKGTMKGHKGRITGTAFSPFNRFLLSSAGMDAAICLYDVEKKILVKTIHYSVPFSSIAFKHDGYTIAGGCLNGYCVFFDLKVGSKPTETIKVDEKSILHLAFSVNI